VKRTTTDLIASARSVGPSASSLWAATLAARTDKSGGAAGALDGSMVEPSRAKEESQSTASHSRTNDYPYCARLVLLCRLTVNLPLSGIGNPLMRREQHAM
jgi:hypothetical protein